MSEIYVWSVCERNETYRNDHSWCEDGFWQSETNCGVQRETNCSFLTCAQIGDSYGSFSTPNGEKNETCGNVRSWCENGS
jgi:hypothetical protein